MWPYAKDNGKMSRVVLYLVLFSFIVMGCSSSTMIRSRPDGADVFVDNVRIGRTPVTYSDTAILGTAKPVRLEKEGYKPFYTTLRKDEFKVGPCIGGVFVLVPFLWVLGYPDAYEFELEKNQR